MGGYAAWSTYQHTTAPGPRAAWATVAGAVAVGCFEYIIPQMRKQGESTNDTLGVVDARGVRRAVTHTHSAGLLARKLPSRVRQELGSEGLLHSQTPMHLPPRRLIIAIVVVTGGLILCNGGNGPPYILPLVLWLGFMTCRKSSHLSASMARVYLARGHCPSCVYPLGEVPADSDGATICPECGAAWAVQR